MKLASVSLLGFLVLGCSTIQNVSPATIESSAKNAVFYGLSYALKKYPDKAAAITVDAKLADTVLRQNVIPVFSGASTGDVLRSAVDTALAQLSSKISSEAALGLQAALDLIYIEIPLPKNPADKLDDWTKNALKALFTGMAEGIEAVLASAPPPPAVTPPPVPPPAPAGAPPTARLAVPKLYWPVGK